jgi:hypothetical protein
MEDLGIVMSRREAGRALHRAETRIHLSRAALGELLVEEPVDEEGVFTERSAIRDAREERNALRGILEAAKAREAVPPIW